ncbi:atrial natriuretic peptide receptor 1-like [Paramacrobiotus metropolitanus]|uniref:atrial natriuretic peptide receptor 1-like n=1 Tax=Paramacrobiotus metropolitanus TaxID=2943436 RepID=UPI002445ABE7|nr:atrial natriuretic peptide receptor 1-like [Paramacrobiotus metropolitanus]
MTKYLTNKLEFNSRESQDYTAPLTRMQNQSRVGVIIAHPRVVRDIMVTANRLNMTNGDYIFFTVQTTLVPGQTELLWQFFDGNDEAAFDGFQSLINFQNPNPRWELISDVLEKAQNISFERYNRSVSRNEQRKDLAIAGYESVIVFARVMEEALLGDANVLTGISFVKRFYNRLFNDAWHYDSFSSNIREFSPKLANSWKSRDGPPPDVPQCGFHNNLCTASTTPRTVTGIVAAIAVIVCIGLISTVYWKRSNEKFNKSTWWYLPSTDLQPYSDLGPAGVLLRQLHAATEISVGINRRLYCGQAVVIESFYGKCLTVEQILAQVTFRSVLQQMRNLHHQNLNKFIGITATKACVMPAGSCMVFEYGARDTLLMLIQSEPIYMDHAFKTITIWEIVHGLRYLHRSMLHYHGNLSSLGIMIDKRFCLKISSYAVAKFRGKLYGSVYPTELPLDPSILWAAPEVISGASIKATKESDMYSLGVIISEIFTSRTPLQTNFAITDSVHENVAVLRKNPNVTRIEDTSEMPAELVGIVDSCISINQLERPTMTGFAAALSQVIPCKKMLDLVTSRLDQYSGHLEDLVEVRARQLMDERSKVDSLLREMLPETVVNQLRNKHIVAAEHFECVTLSFSDIPQFERIVAQCPPLQTIALLNTVYSVFDSILPRFDVYKVETIGASYLLASGLPKRNGIRHAGEIARMTLTMLQAAESIHSPMEPAEGLRLRVGIHSGHCAAGVVGLKMPRYCLFGDTINTANRMETYGAASRIHVSGTTKHLLDQIGGFETESRGAVIIKGKGEMVTFWLLH